MTQSPADFMSSAPAPPGGSSAWASLALPSGHVALCDAADLPTVERFKWHVLKARNTFYVQTKGSVALGQGRTYLHRLLMGAGPDQLVDHRNHDGLDNRRSNLRLATSGQNNVNAPGRNATGYRGVHLHPNHLTKPWRARLNNRHLGYFATEWEAAEVYNAAALTEYGEFALLNVRQP